jgi:hypothetical protein
LYPVRLRLGLLRLLVSPPPGPWFRPGPIWCNVCVSSNSRRPDRVPLLPLPRGREPRRVHLQLLVSPSFAVRFARASPLCVDQAPRRVQGNPHFDAPVLDARIPRHYDPNPPRCPPNNSAGIRRSLSAAKACASERKLKASFASAFRSARL